VTNGIRSLTDGYNTDDSNHSNNLLPPDAMHSADCGVEICLSVDLFVHPSVCLPVTRRYSVETAKQISSIFFHHWVATCRCTK